MADTRTPFFRATTATAAGQFLDWSALARMGAVYLRNAGPDEVFIAWEALPGAAAIGDGRWRMLQNESINLDAAKVSRIGLLCAVGDTGVVEAIGMVRPGVGGSGIG